METLSDVERLLALKKQINVCSYMVYQDCNHIIKLTYLSYIIENSLSINLLKGVNSGSPKTGHDSVRENELERITLDIDGAQLHGV